MNLNRLSGISDAELLLELENRKKMALEIKSLRIQLGKAISVLEFVKNASSPANKGTVLEMVSRKVIKYFKDNKHQ